MHARARVCVLVHFERLVRSLAPVACIMFRGAAYFRHKRQFAFHVRETTARNTRRMLKTRSGIPRGTRTPNGTLDTAQQSCSNGNNVNPTFDETAIVARLLGTRRALSRIMGCGMTELLFGAPVSSIITSDIISPPVFVPLSY